MSEDLPTSSPLPLFTLDLGENGGVLAPTSAADLYKWLERELQAWSWVASVNSGNHKGAVDNAFNPLRNALGVVQQAVQFESSSPDSMRSYVAQVQAAIQDTYVSKGFPHATSAPGQRIEEIRKRDPLEAIAYLYTRLPNANGYQFDSRDLSSWRGFLTGMNEQLESAGIPQQAYQAALKSVTGTQAELARTLAEKTAAYNALHRNYEQISEDITEAHKSHTTSFEAFLDSNQQTYDNALTEHQGNMKMLEAAFREKMALRAPVEYWEDRHTHHQRRTQIMGRWSFGAMAVLAVLIGLVAWWVLHNLSPEGKPEVWRVSVLVLVGVLGVWATRLLVRMFLSHIHLTTDAAERVVMVKTYLALLEGEKLPSDDERKLILQALFRPASDGIVKDEGLPHPALEALTKLGSR